MVSLQREVDIVIQTLFETIPDNRIDGSYDKLFEKMYEPDMPLRLLPPYIGSSDEEYHNFVRLLRSGSRNGCLKHRSRICTSIERLPP